MLAFAANSLLNRLALQGETIDFASFAALRVVSGAAMLWLWLAMTGRLAAGTWRVSVWGPISLVVYAAGFSWAYLQIEAGVGALILFGLVQLTMTAVGYHRGKTLSLTGWAGVCLAVTGLIGLMLPGASTPPWQSAFVMAVAGVAWGVYSLLGQTAKQPLVATTYNFVWSVPLVLIFLWWFRDDVFWQTKGVLLALASGMIASAMGYALWYRVLPQLAPATAASLQLSVPVIASFGGVVLLQELLTLRLILASLLILGGIALVLRRPTPGT